MNKNRLDGYRDNILSKIRGNENLDALIDYTEKYVDFNKGICLKADFASPKIYVERGTFLKVLKELKKYNDDMIDMYLQLSYDDKFGEHRNKQLKEENQCKS